MEHLINNFDFNYTYDYSYDHSDYDSVYPDIYDDNSFDFATISRVITWIVVLTGFPLTLLAIYALFTLVRNDHVAPVFVINLLISDLIQLCCLSVWLADAHWMNMHASVIYIFGVTASIFFMVIVAMERYLVIAWPLWYNLRRTIKLSVVVCVVVWTLSIVFILSLYFCLLSFCLPFDIARIIFGVSFLVPFPLLIFFLVGSLKALSAANRLSSDEKLRIVGILVLVLLIYTLLFLPSIISVLGVIPDLFVYSLIPLEFSLLADLIMYVFIRKGALDKLLCCCRTDSNSSA